MNEELNQYVNQYVSVVSQEYQQIINSLTARCVQLNIKIAEDAAIRKTLEDKIKKFENQNTTESE